MSDPEVHHRLPEHRPPDHGPRIATDLLFGFAAGAAFILVAERTGGEDSQAFWVLPPVLGFLLGPLLLRGGSLPAMASFYASALALLGVYGHLNLLPFAMMFLVVPTLLFGAAVIVVQLILPRKSRP